MTLLLSTSVAPAQLSPGPLSRAHADLDTNQRCLDCHGGGSDTLDQNCLACHREIRRLVDHDRGLHATLSGQACATCHPEHAGRDFELIAWPRGGSEGFDHDDAGWPLAGAHARVECRRCHRLENQRDPVMQHVRRADRGSSWLGLVRECVACHTDPHEGRLDGDCVSCHGLDSWKPAPRFDHDSAAFALTGRHVDLPCERCHLVPDRVFVSGPEGKPRPRFKPLAHKECSSCHEDVHLGRLGPACSRCHVSEGFDVVTREGFDHSKTRFPLRYEHATVLCETCHDAERAWGPRPRFESCGDCHADAHAGLATLQHVPADCSACHDERRFQSSTYSVATHASSAYPLAGLHAQVTCRQCHVRDESRGELGSSEVDLRPGFATCRACHEDTHRGEFDARADGGACETCHTLDGWKPSQFTVDQHSELELPLAGRHVEIECAACHGADRPRLSVTNTTSAQMAFALDTTCASCHRDTHGGRFANDCNECHGALSWRPSTVDSRKHARFDYALEQAHAAVPCNLCHEQLTTSTEPSSRRARSLPCSSSRLTTAAKTVIALRTAISSPIGPERVPVTSVTTSWPSFPRLDSTISATPGSHSTAPTGK